MKKSSSKPRRTKSQYKNCSEMSDAEFRSMVISALRQRSRFWKPAMQSKESAYIGMRVNKITGRTCKHYQCSKCKKPFPDKLVKIDHITPVVGDGGFVDWNTFIDRLFAAKEGYQILCSTCHDEKTLIEKQIKKENAKLSGENKV